MPTLDLEFGGDLTVSQNGGLNVVVGWDEVRQRIIRRLCTCAKGFLPDGTPLEPEYLFDTAYGVGLPALIGQPMNATWLGQLQQKVIEGVMVDEAVAPTTPPTVQLYQIAAYTFWLMIGVTLVIGGPGRTFAVRLAPGQIGG